MSDRLHVATRKGLFTIDRSSKGTWSVRDLAFFGDNVTICLRDPRSGALYAALDHGHFGAKLQRSTDDGRTWDEIGTPTYPEKPDGHEPKQPAVGEPAPWKLMLIWSLVPGGPDEDGLLWCGTIPGGFFKSTDHGATWSINEPLWYHPKREDWFGGGADYPGVHSVCVDPRDSRHLRLGVSCGGVWHTRDAGESWFLHEGGMRAEFMPPEQAYEPNAQDPHQIAQCPAQPDACWVQHHNGIFRSTDGGMNWTEITDVKPSTFGFPVVVHPADGDTAWFVPAQKDEKRVPVDGKVVVTRTRDGGKTFEQLREGLPQQHAYDLVFRHAMDIDESGDRIAFGSTTGNLWITENGGDSWTSLAHHLPPVYCVRFVKD